MNGAKVPAFIFDASALVKRYVQETGTDVVQALTDTASVPDIYITRISRVEIVAAFTRRSKSGLTFSVNFPAIIEQFYFDAMHQYNILEIIPEILNEAELLAQAHGLRGYDAVQLAASKHLSLLRIAAGLDTLILVSADEDLNTAAEAEGLEVYNPINPV